MRSLFFLFTFCLLITGCKVGPNYHPPAAPIPDDFVENQPNKTEEVDDEDLIQWWSIFNDPFLSELIEIAVGYNFDYRIAIEKVYQARAQYWVQFTQILPEVDASATATRFKVSQSFGTTPDAPSDGDSGIAPPPVAATTTISPFQNFFQIGLAAIWEIDLFGKLRRSAEAAHDLWEASMESMRGVKIVVITEVANTYATICAYQKKKDIAEQAVNLDLEILSLSESRFNSGLTNQQEVETAMAAVNTDRAQLIFIDASLKQFIYSLSILLGMLPENVIELFQIERPIPHSEGKVPISLPADLLKRRPDILTAERELAAATEQIGVAIAQMFPTLSLAGSSSSFAANPLQGANIGFSSDSFPRLFRPESLIWGIGGFMTVPVFDFGKRQAAVNVQVALRNQAYYAYQKTVIAALQETEQALEQYFHEERREMELNKAVQANWRYLAFTMDLFQAGLANYTQLLVAKDVWLTSVNTLTDSQQALTIDLISIYKALGGDW